MSQSSGLPETARFVRPHADAIRAWQEEWRQRLRLRAVSDRAIALGLFLLVFALAAPGVRRYGIVWDEPTYFNFARLQRGWCGDLISALVHPLRLGPLLSEKTIAEVWLQHPVANGHPPLNELWMGLASVPFRALGASDIQAFRMTIVLLLSISAGFLYLLLRRGLCRTAALVGVAAFLGVPAIWAHGHLGATETIQNGFWILLAWLLPRALDRGGRWLFLWLIASALSFMAKFTNVLIPVWVLGTAGVLGAWRRPRFWIAAACALVVGPLLLVILDPFFWPWQGGIGRFIDYLGQVTTRGQLTPISVFYEGKSWGFAPPWHYRLVMIAATTPLPLLLLVVPGLVFAGAATWRAVREQAARRDFRQEWPRALGFSGFLFAQLVGVLPNSPNHDGTRQFAYMFVATALLAGTGAEGVLQEVRRRWATRRPRMQQVATAGVASLALAGFGISLAHEPWGLSYYSEWIGGERGAWDRGFELTYWTETISPELAMKASMLPARRGAAAQVHTVPKLNYFADAEPFIRPLLPTAARNCPRLASDVFAAYFAPWARPYVNTPRGGILGLSFDTPPDGILISYRRATVAPGLWSLLESLARTGEIDLVDEVRVGGVPLAQLYRVKKVEEVRLPEDPLKRIWWQFPSVAAARGEK
jgi:hypothetical protein